MTSFEVTNTRTDERFVLSAINAPAGSDNALDPGETAARSFTFHIPDGQGGVGLRVGRVGVSIHARRFPGERHGQRGAQSRDGDVSIHARRFPGERQPATQGPDLRDDFSIHARRFPGERPTGSMA